MFTDVLFATLVCGTLSPRIGASLEEIEHCSLKVRK